MALPYGQVVPGGKIAIYTDRPLNWQAERIMLQMLVKAGIDTTALSWFCGFWSKQQQHFNVCITIGDGALYQLTGKKGVAKFRGSILPSSIVPGLKVVPVIHPGWMVYGTEEPVGSPYQFKGNFKWFWVTVLDLQRALRESAFPELKREQWHSIIAPSYQVVRDFLSGIPAGDRWALDIETDPGRGLITCLGIAHEKTALCIPLTRYLGSYWDSAQELTIWRELQALMARNPNLVGQNLSYDLDWLLDFGVEPSGVWMDTMIAWAILYPEFPKSLAMICSVATDAIYYKDEGRAGTTFGDDGKEVKGGHITDEQRWTYNNKDAFYTLQAAGRLEGELRERGLWPLFEETQSYFPMAIEMQKMRLRVDAAELEAFRKVLKELEQDAHTMITISAGKEVNVGSPKQIQQFLYGDLGLEQVTFKGKLTADERALSKLKAKYPTHGILELIIKERHVKKRLSSYVDVALDPDGYLPYAINVVGTETGRWASGKSPKNRGLNVQTVPKMMRKIFLPPPGMVFIQPDLSQAEARYVAYDANCLSLIELLNDPKRHLHLENAKLIYGHDVEKDSVQYLIGKKGIHAAHYMISPKEFALQTEIPEFEAKKILDTIYRLRPEIPAWHQRIRSSVIQTGKLVNAFGRERICYEALAELQITGKLSRDSWKEAVAYNPQSTIPMVINKGMYATWINLPYIRLHQQGHDSCLISCPPEKLGEVCRTIEKTFAIPIPINGWELVIPVEIAWGFNWGEMKGWQGEEQAIYGHWDSWRKKKAAKLSPERFEQELLGIAA